MNSDTYTALWIMAHVVDSPLAQNVWWTAVGVNNLVNWLYRKDNTDITELQACMILVSKSAWHCLDSELCVFQTPEFVLA